MTTPSPNQPTFNGQPFNLAQPPAHRRPPSSSGPAPAVQRASSAAPSPGGFIDQAEAIRQGKQRAKTVMAAHGIDSRPASAEHNPDAAAAGQFNGLVMTRKRSRSGSRIPHKQHPLSTGKSFPIDDDHARHLLSEYMQRDSWSELVTREGQRRTEELSAFKRQEAQRYREEVHKFKESLQGRALMQYGEVKPLVVYPSSRQRPANRRTEELQFSRKLASQQADCVEELVPIRIDIELEKLRLRDTFTWNLNDRIVQAKLFADTLVEDLQIPMENREHVARQVHRDIKEQLETYYPPVFPNGTPAEPVMPYWAHKNDDMRITIRLNITVGHISLVDQFEWDVNNSENSPEDFALQMSKDLSLSGEFTTAIAHSIREQSQLYIKSLYLSNYEFDGRMIEDPDIRDNMLASPMYSSFRPLQMQKDYAPFLFELTEADLEKTELSILREQRAQKRQLNRRGGPALPDLKERQRTTRSLVVSAVIPGAAETLEASGVLKIRRVASNRGRRRVADEGSDTSDVDMEDSGPDSPAPSAINIGTTARTRGMRGAATVAQAALKSSYGRSATPDFLLAEPSKSAARRFMNPDYEDSGDPTSLIVKLKLNPAKFKTWLAKRRFGRTGAPPLSGFPTSMFRVDKKEPNTPKAPSTPSLPNKSLVKNDADTPNNRSAESTPQPQFGESKHHDDGRVDADRTPLTTQDPPEPPAWLEKAIKRLQARHPTASIHALMRFSTLDALTGRPVPYDINTLPPGTAAPHGPAKDADGKTLADKIRFAWLPRIRCSDCPGKLYNPVQDKEDAGFEVHLRMRKHRANVEERVRREAGREEGEVD